MAESPFSLSTFSAALSDLVERASAIVVAVDARPRRPGSGIIIGPDLVVTADHLLERDEVLVHHGERQLPATIAGRDPASDLAVVRVGDLGGERLQAGAIPPVGALAISVSRTTRGRVSAAAGLVNAIAGPLRTGSGIALDQVIRTDASRPGTSGGAIVDAGGRVIGMTTWGLVRGAAVGIPAGELLGIADALAAHTPIKRAYLGVNVQRVKFPRARHEGAEDGLLVFGVAPASAADEAGVLVGDVIVAYDDARLSGAEDLQGTLARSRAGTKATLSVIRGEELRRLDVTLGARPSA